MPRKQNEACAANDLLIATCLPGFFKLVPTEEAALDLILQMQVHEQKLICKCGYVFEDAKREMYERKVICKECKKRTYFTVGTLYEGVSSVQARLATVWMMDHGAVVTSTKLNQLFGISTSTGLIIINTIGAFIEAFRGLTCDWASAKISCPFFTEIMSRRSRITGAYEHASAIPEPVVVVDEEVDAEVDLEVDVNVDVEHSDESNSTDDIGDFEKEVLAQISTVPKSVDELCQLMGQAPSAVGAALTVLELFGYIDPAPGNRYQRRSAGSQETADTTISEEEMALVESAIKNIKAIRQGVSRKYLQLYLAVFWCFFDREFWRIGSLLSVSVDRSLSPDRNLFAYESPLVVSLVPAIS